MTEKQKAFAYTPLWGPSILIMLVAVKSGFFIKIQNGNGLISSNFYADEPEALSTYDNLVSTCKQVFKKQIALRNLSIENQI